MTPPNNIKILNQRYLIFDLIHNQGSCSILMFKLTLSGSQKYWLKQPHPLNGF